MVKQRASFDSLVNNFLLLSVFLFPVTVLLVKGAGSLIFALVALTAIVVFFSKAFKTVFSREEKLLFYSCLFLFLMAMLTAWLGGFDNAAWKKMDTFLNLLLTVPVYFLFRHYFNGSRVIWIGLMAGVVLCGVVAIYELNVGPLYGGFQGRAKAATHPILFADITLSMSFMVLISATVIKQWNAKVIMTLVLILLFGLTAVVLSQSRGAWVVVPFLMILVLWQLSAVISKKMVTASVVAGLVVVVVAYFVPATGLKSRTDTTISNVQKYAEGTHKSTSIGTRFEMWSASLTIFNTNPVHGVGWGNYKEAARDLVDQGVVSKSAASWNHPHNQFLSAMSNGGMLMLFALLLFTLVPLLLFKRLLYMGDAKVKAYALSGITLIVSYAGFGLSESIFERSIPTVFYAFYLALLFAMAYRAKEECSQQKIERTEKLSVIVIAYNEVDRLGDCLASVKDWADEIIVFDNGSSDGTIELARQYTDQVFVTDWPGFGPQKQRALEQSQYDWVLSIDADERLTPELRVEIDKVLSSGPKEIAFRIPWAVTIYNKRLDFGRSGRAPLRLFKKKGAKFSEASVHEKVLLPAGRVGLLNERLLHYTHRNLQHAVKKFNDYAWLWGTERFAKGKRVTFVTPIFNSLWTFIVTYFLRLGMLDGFRGLVMAVHLSLYTFNKYTVLWTLEKQQDN